MDAVICGLSAWQFWRTPPLLSSGEFDPLFNPTHLCASTGLAASVFKIRSNARPADRLVQSRLFGDLVGVTLPVQVMVPDGSCGMRPTALTVPHRLLPSIPEGGIVDLGNGLGVLSPEATICMLAKTLTHVELAKLILEACGIFTLVPQTGRVKHLVNELSSQGVLTRERCGRDGIFGYSDAAGNPLGTLDAFGDDLPWTPSFDRSGRVTDLWKRTPLTSIEAIEAYARRIGFDGNDTLKRALAMSANGSASPAEAKAYLLLCSGAWNGGESFGEPSLNRRVVYTPEASALAGGRFCVADILWAGTKRDLEIQSEEYHADDLGYREASGRTSALENMGYTVAELTYQQMADLELFDAVLPTLAKKLGFELRERSVAFLRRRAKLHAALFCKPYEPCV